MTSVANILDMAFTSDYSEFSTLFFKEKRDISGELNFAGQRCRKAIV